MSFVFPLIDEKDEAEQEPERGTKAVFFIREKPDPLHHQWDVGIAIEGVDVLNELPSPALIV